MRFVNSPNREGDLLELALRGLGSFAGRTPPTLVSTNGRACDFEISPRFDRRLFATIGFGEGIRDGLAETEDALEGKRPNPVRLVVAPIALSVLGTSLSNIIRVLVPCKRSSVSSRSRLGVPSRLGLGGGVLDQVCGCESFCATNDSPWSLCSPMASFKRSSGASLTMFRLLR